MIYKMPEEKQKPKDLTNEDVELYVKSLEEIVATKLPAELFDKVKKIAHYIGRKGMSVGDACLLVDIDVDKFKEVVEKYPIVTKLIQTKELEYKSGLLSVLSRKARSGDDKLAQYLLERRFPDEFGSIDKRRKLPDGSEQNIFEQAIVFIQQHGDSVPLVNPAAGKPLAEKKKKSVVEKVKDILN